MESCVKYRPFKRKKVLLVDDEKDMGWILGKIVRDAGHYFAFACTWQEALSRLQRGKNIDVVIVDVRLGAVSGLALLQKAKRQNAAVCLVMLTAVEAADVESKARRLGADYFFHKPVKVERLLEILNR